MLLAAADTSSQFAFDATRENAGMLVMGVIVVVTWLAFRKMVQLSEKSRRGEGPQDPAAKAKSPPPPEH